jgi:cytidylate kinase
MIVAIDGPSAAGKGTLSKRLAAHLGFAHLDTGKIYRAVGMMALRVGGDLANESVVLQAAKSLEPSAFNDPELGSDIAAVAASRVAAITSVRTLLLQFQRDFAAVPPGDLKGAVLDGRDIGTVVCPEAEIKLYVTANTDIRAERRHKELLERGESIMYAGVLQDMKERDERDTNRSVAPLKPAEDAFIIDTSDLDADQAFAAALAEIKRTGR